MLLFSSFARTRRKRSIPFSVSRRIASTTDDDDDFDGSSASPKPIITRWRKGESSDKSRRWVSKRTRCASHARKSDRSSSSSSSCPSSYSLSNNMVFLRSMHSRNVTLASRNERSNRRLAASARFLNFSLLFFCPSTLSSSSSSSSSASEDDDTSEDEEEPNPLASLAALLSAYAAATSLSLIAFCASSHKNFTAIDAVSAVCALFSNLAIVFASRSLRSKSLATSRSCFNSFAFNVSINSSSRLPFSSRSISISRSRFESLVFIVSINSSNLFLASPACSRTFSFSSFNLLAPRFDFSNSLSISRIFFRISDSSSFFSPSFDRTCSISKLCFICMVSMSLFFSSFIRRIFSSHAS
mmetsp:Transcript_3594/g.11048  ORF Transcript_3594/g.11048 Transcript_3594/m.11048 type:complete len:356 (-) Transcript_3594:378-1445(-)